VTQIRRQPGSGFKPFTYAVAINKGYPPTYPLLNEKFNYNGWSPDNSSGGYGGYMTLREGLARSVNIIAGRMTTSEIAPPSEVAAMAKRCGIKSKLIPYPSIALGTSEVMPIEMAAGFATFANGGTYHEPMGVLKIEDRNGIVIAEYSNSSSSALSAQTTAILTSMMQDVMKYGTGAPASRWFTRPSAGKTGTTQDYADAWFTGFTPQLAGSVWVGFDDSRIKFGGSYGQGALAALPIWARFMGETYRRINMPLQYFSLPSGVVSADFCTESILQGEAALANPGCPSVQTDLILADKEIPHCRFHGNSPINLPPITSPSGKTY
jgi:penicillin-binding protein 1A